MNTISKIFCLVIMLSSFLFIYLTGKSNVNNFRMVQRSIDTIYKDRLIVKSLIFELSTILYQSQILSIDEKNVYSNQIKTRKTRSFDTIIKEFKNTVLTPLEERTLKDFERKSKKLKTSLSTSELAVTIQSMHMDLITLSKIQIEEGKRKLETGDFAVEKMQKYASYETYAMVILAILMLLVLFAPVNFRKSTKENGT